MQLVEHGRFEGAIFQVLGMDRHHRSDLAELLQVASVNVV